MFHLIFEMDNKRLILFFVVLLLILFSILFKKSNAEIVFINIDKETTFHQDIEYSNEIVQFLSKGNRLINQILPKDESIKLINLSLQYLKQIYHQNPSSSKILPTQILNNYQNLIVNISYNLTYKKDFVNLKLHGSTNNCLITKKYSSIPEKDVYDIAENFVDNVTNCLYDYIIKKKSNFVFVGTDHGLSIFTIKLAKKLKPNSKIGLFVFDEHVDIYDLEDEYNIITKANVFGKMLLEGYVDYIVFIGASDTAKDIVEISVNENFTKKHIFDQMSVYSDKDLENGSIKAIINKEIEKMRRRGTTNVMVSIDVDVLPSYYTGFEYSILAPSIGQILRLRKNNLEKVLAEFQDGFSKGFEPEELSSYVEMIKNSTLRNRMKFGAGRTTKILGDVQELLPKQDINNATANATLIIIKSFFN